MSVSPSVRGLVIASLLCVLPIIIGGCARKCEPGSSAYPSCLPDASPAVSAELTIWNLGDPSDSLEGQIQEFESRNPGVSIELKVYNDPIAYEQLLINELAEGNGPDIFAIEDDWLPRHINKISPMPETIMSVEQFTVDFYDVAQDMLLRDGTIYGLPLSVDTLALYYNRQIFRDGLPSSSRPAASWAEILNQVIALTQSNNSAERFAISGIAMGYGNNIALAPDIFRMLLLQNGGAIYNFEDGEAILSNQKGVRNTGNPSVNYPARNAATEYTSYGLPSFKNFNWNNLIGSSYPQLNEVGVFAQGKVAMIFGYSSTYEEIVAAIEGLQRRDENIITSADIGVSFAPQRDNNGEIVARDSLAKVHALTVSRNSETPNAAWSLVKYLTGTESARAYHEVTKKPTARFDLYDEQAIEETWGVFVRQVPYAKLMPTLGNDGFNRIIREALDGIANGTQSVNEAINVADKRLQCVWESEVEGVIDQDCFALDL